MRVRAALLAAAAAGVLALAACCGQTGDPAGGSDGGSDGGGTGGGTPVDLEFTVGTVDGGTFEGSSMAGKPAVLWFWAPWCPTCVAEAPHVSDLAGEYAGQVTVVGVAGWTTASRTCASSST